MARKPRKAAKTPKAPKEKKQTPAKAAEVRGNLSDDTIRELLYGAVALDKDVQILLKEVATARSAYSNHKKKAKKLGLEPDDVTWYVAQCKREPEDIDRETRRRTRIARATKLPITAQLGLFDDGTTVAAAIDQDAIAALPDYEKMTSEEAYAAGANAYKASQSWEACPFKDDADPRRSSWLSGWDAGHFDSTSKIVPLEQPAAQHSDVEVPDNDTPEAPQHGDAVDEMAEEEEALEF